MNQLKLLSCSILGALLVSASPGTAQTTPVPGRDLLTFPIGLGADPAALGTLAPSGIWNPAGLLVPEGFRWGISVAGMATSHDDIGADGQMVAVARSWNGTTFGLSAMWAAVSDLLRTDDSPLATGGEIPYSTMLVSIGAARRVTESTTLGLAMRLRSGTADNITRTRASLDAGVRIEHIGDRDARIGASTFLLPLPGAASERLSLQGAFDLRVVGRDSLRAGRAGLSLQQTRDGPSEQYLFGTGRWDRWEALGGLVRSTNYSSATVGLRLGVSMHYGLYTLGVAREESANGLSARYHFLLSTLIK